MLDEAVVGIAQWLPAPGRPEQNLASALDLVRELAEAGSNLAVLPELWPCGYDWGSLATDVRAAAEPLAGPRNDRLAEAARANRLWLAAGSVPERDGETIYNTALLFDPQGNLRAAHRKAHLYTPLGEDRAVTAGERITVCSTEEFGTLGLSICFDGDFPEVARAMALGGARMILHVCAYELAAQAWWDGLYPANALANGQWWVMANQCGTTASGTFMGGSQVISPLGRVIARAGRAGQGESPAPELLVVRLNLREALQRADEETGVLRSERRPEVYARGAAPWSPGIVGRSAG